MKIVAMIPARLGSTRVRNKNLRLINNKPLVQYIIDTVKQVKKIDSIYLNSESDIFEIIAKKNNINFYKRPKELSSNAATNDEFAFDFLNSIQCDVLIQLLPTSPFIKTSEVEDFIDQMLLNNYDTLISVINIQIESLYKKKPLNFDKMKKTPPSQNLQPIEAYSCGIMGWKTKNFITNIKKYSAAYHGGEGKIGYFQLKGFSTVDIDNEEDFILAEAIAESMNQPNRIPTYFNSKKNNELIFDKDVNKILKDDGVYYNSMDSFNKEVVSIDQIIKNNSNDKSWSHTIVNSPSNRATLIAQIPGEGNRMHFHPNWDEWWYILQGIWEWNIEGKRKIVKKGEVAFIKRNKKHKITAKGNEMAIRLAVSRSDVDHVYVKDDY